MSLILVVGRETARVRRLVARRPWLRWIPITACALGFTASVISHRDDVERARAAWGDQVEVWVADAELEPGRPVAARPRHMPTAVVPSGAVDADPNGATARQRVGPGEIVTAADLTRGSPPGSLMPDGWLAVPVDESTPSGAEIGDQVQLAADGMTIADDAIVVAMVDAVPLVAVPADQAPMVALANESGVTLLRAP